MNQWAEQEWYWKKVYHENVRLGLSSLNLCTRDSGVCVSPVTITLGPVPLDESYWPCFVHTRFHIRKKKSHIGRALPRKDRVHLVRKRRQIISQSDFWVPDSFAITFTFRRLEMIKKRIGDMQMSHSGVDTFVINRLARERPISKR